MSQPQQPAPRFEETLNELAHIVSRLNQADVPLDDAIALYERGVRLAAHGRELLNKAEQRVAQRRDGGGDEPSA
jgi:exodeoxyribonuclease VII small subunit